LQALSDSYFSDLKFLRKFGVSALNGIYTVPSTYSFVTHAAPYDFSTLQAHKYIYSLILAMLIIRNLCLKQQKRKLLPDYTEFDW
jgi:hypothetical protein